MSLESASRMARWAGVVLLELVDHQVLEALGDLAAGVGSFHQQDVEREEDVAAVEAPASARIRSCVGVELGELELAPRGLAVGFVAAPPGPASRRASSARPVPPSAVDPRQEPRQQPGRVAADLVAAQRQQSKRSSRTASRSALPSTSKKVEAGRLGVLAQQPLADRLPAADPELLIRPASSASERSRAAARWPGSPITAPLGRRPGRREAGQPPRQELRLAGPGGAKHQQGPSRCAAARPAVRFRSASGVLTIVQS